MTKKEIAEKHGFINGMSLYSNTETIEQKLYEAMQEYADQEQLNLSGVVSTCCDPVGEGFYLGTSCPKCKQPFSQNLK